MSDGASNNPWTLGEQEREEEERWKPLKDTFNSFCPAWNIRLFT
jgi:hypothetical protein